MSRRLLYTILSCTALTPLHAHATWEYSLAAKLAMYDAFEQQCRPVYPAAFESKSAETVMHLDAEERSQMKIARQSAEYREVLSEAKKEIVEQLAAGGVGGAAKVCKGMIDRFMPAPKS